MERASSSRSSGSSSTICRSCCLVVAMPEPLVGAPTRLYLAPLSRTVA
jgi:hypothetical protein